VIIFFVLFSFALLWLYFFWSTMEPLLVCYGHLFPRCQETGMVFPAVPFDIYIFGPRCLADEGYFAKVLWAASDNNCKAEEGADFEKKFRQQGSISPHVSFRKFSEGLSIAYVQKATISYSARQPMLTIIATAHTRKRRILTRRPAYLGKSSTKFGDLSTFPCFCCQVIGGLNGSAKLCLCRDTAHPESFAANKYSDPNFATCNVCMRRWALKRGLKFLDLDLSDRIRTRIPLVFERKADPPLSPGASQPPSLEYIESQLALLKLQIQEAHDNEEDEGEDEEEEQHFECVDANLVGEKYLKTTPPVKQDDCASSFFYSDTDFYKYYDSDGLYFPSSCCLSAE
jgi:hypothetical protein